MIDIRVLRDDPEGVKAALARRGVEESEIDAVLAADVAHRALQTRSESLRAEVKALSRLVGEARRDGDDTGRRGCGRGAGSWGKRSARRRPRPRRRGRRSTRHSSISPTSLPTRCPTGKAMSTTSRSAGGGPARRPAPPSRCGPTISRCRTGRSATPCGLLDMERGARLSGSMFPLYRGAGARLLRALTALALDHHTPAYEEIRPPTVGPDRDDGLHRPPPQVRRRRLPPRTRRPVGDPHRRGAAHLHAPGRDPRRVGPAAALHRRHRLLPPRGGLGRARHAWAVAGARVRQGRAVRLHHARRRPSTRRPTSCRAPSRCCRSSSCAIG